MSYVSSLIFRGKSKAIIIIIIKYINKLISVWSSLSLWFFHLWWFWLTFNKTPPIHYLNKLKYFRRPIKKKHFWWNVGLLGSMFIYCMYSILGRGSFCFNYCLISAWYGGDQFVALLRWYGSSGAMHINNQKLSFYIFTVGNLQNIFIKHDLYLISWWFLSK